MKKSKPIYLIKIHPFYRHEERIRFQFHNMRFEMTNMCKSENFKSILYFERNADMAFDFLKRIQGYKNVE